MALLLELLVAQPEEGGYLQRQLLLQPVEPIEATPGALPADPHADPAKLVTECLNDIGLTYACEAKGRLVQVRLQGLSHYDVAPVIARGPRRLLLQALVLGNVVELGVGHVDEELIEHVGMLGVMVEAHRAQPLKVLIAGLLVLDEQPEPAPLVHVLTNQVLDLLPPEGR